MKAYQAQKGAGLATTMTTSGLMLARASKPRVAVKGLKGLTIITRIGTIIAIMIIVITLSDISIVFVASIGPRVIVLGILRFR